MATLVQVAGVWVVVVVAVVSGAPHHSTARQLRAADGTPKGSGRGKDLAGAVVVRGKRRIAAVDEEECDEWELLLSPPRKRPHNQAATADDPKKREALEVDIGTGIIVQGGTTSKRPFRFPQNRPFIPSRPVDATTLRPIFFPNARPQAIPSTPVNRPTQPSPTIYHDPFFPSNLFPSAGSRPFSPGEGIPTQTTPRLPPFPSQPPLGSSFPSDVFPGQTTPNSLFPGIPTQRPRFPTPPNLGPDYISPTTHRPKFPGFPFSVIPTTRRPCNCRNHTSPPPSVFLSPVPVGPPVTPVPQFLNQTPGVRPSVAGPPVTSRPQFLSLIPTAPLPPSAFAPPVSTPSPQLPTPGVHPSVAGPPVTSRPQFPSFIPTAPRPPPAFAPPVTPRPRLPTLGINRPTILTPPITQRPQLFNPTPGALRPLPAPAPSVSSHPVPAVPDGFGVTVRPSFTPVASLPLFPNTQPRRIVIVPYYPPQTINTRPSGSNFLLPRYPSRQLTTGQVIATPSPLRTYYINQPSHQAPKKHIQLKETVEKKP